MTFPTNISKKSSKLGDVKGTIRIAEVALGNS
jgi:hypothetical protein